MLSKKFKVNVEGYFTDKSSGRLVEKFSGRMAERKACLEFKKTGDNEWRGTSMVSSVPHTELLRETH